MRFLMICMQYPLGPGDSYMTSELADALVTEGHEVQVLLLDWHGAVDDQPEELTSPSGVRVLRCSPRRLDMLGRTIGDASKFLLSSRHLASVARSRLNLREFDVAMAWMPLTAIAPLVPLLSAAGIRHRLLFIWDFFPDHHREIGRIPGGLPYLVARYSEARLLRHFSTIFCTLPGNADYLRRNFTLTDEQRVRIAPIWCDATPRPPVDRAATRRRHDLPLDRPIAVFGGQLVAGRGFEQIFAAAQNAAEEQSSLLFLFVGDGALAAQLRQRSLFHSNIRWLPAMSRDAYLELLGACDVGMTVTVPGVTSFSIPSKTLDYLRTGIPIIAAVEAESDFIRLLEEYGVGIGISFGEARDFRREADRLATDPAVKAGIGPATRHCLDEVFDVRHAVANVLDAVGAVREPPARGRRQSPPRR